MARFFQRFKSLGKSEFQLFSECFLQGANCIAAVADLLLFFELHLCKRSCFAIGDEQRIVTEAHVAYGCVVYFATAFAFEDNGLADDKFTIVILGYSLVRKSAEVTGFAVFTMSSHSILTSIGIV